jgi:transposase
VPLYRQAEMLLRDKISVSRQTLGSYVLQAGKALKPLYDLLAEEIRKSGNIFVDETPIDMLAPGKGKTIQGYMTVMAGGESLNPALKVYTFLTSRKHEGFERLLEGYSGVFHSDKYQAYEKEAKKQGKIWCPCYAHIRRKFVEAGEDPLLQKEILLLLQELFGIEEKSKDLEPEQRIQMRVEKAIPIIDALLQKAKERLSRRLLPRSNIGKAIGYLLGLSPYLKNYIQNPYARLDNNVAERALKLVVIGRKNWMFVGNQQGGEASSVIYSLAQTCRALQINPQEYFDDILRRIQGHPYHKLAELLPQNWKRR